MNEGERPDLTELNPDDVVEPGPLPSDQDQEAPTDEVEEEEVEEASGGGIFGWLGRTSPYTILLFAALVAMVIAGACLYAEWMRYEKDTKARGAKQMTAWSAPYHAGPASTMAKA